jgi:hypothetical protein
LPTSPCIETQFAPAKKHGIADLAITFSSDTLKAAAESYLGPKYQEGFVLGRQGINPAWRERRSIWETRCGVFVS